MFALKLAAIAAMAIGAVARDSVHLINCNFDDSVVVFCNDDSNCDFNPAPNNFCVFHAGGTGTWEGSTQSCDFPTGTVFTWNIKSAAQSQNNFTPAGTASNSAGQNFQCFKDDQHTMYIDSAGRNCKSVYYCLSV
ncbi:hypothetical protein GE09DRAFT_1216884 [Coniochaeta sp. 2T2.1]|nr:hypothetical protein GE09DRAFT_1216884 [Coniochaeta sp. 2T2.1]